MVAPVVTATVSEGADPCVGAKEQRARVEGLLREGKLDRAVRVIRRADESCAKTAPETWGALVGALAELGRDGEVKEVAEAIEKAGADVVSAEVKAAAKGARAAVAAREAARFDDAAKEASRAAADAAFLELRGLHYAEAEKGFRKALELWPANAEALLWAGIAAKEQGHRADGQRLLDRAAVALEKAAGQPIALLERPHVERRAQRLAEWSADGRRMVVAAGEHVVVLDATRGLREAMWLRAGTAEIAALAVSADGSRIAVAGKDKSVRLFDGATGAATKVLVGHTEEAVSLAFARDGRTLASASTDKTVRLWDVETGSLRTTFQGHQNGVVTAAFSPDGAKVASGGWERKVLVWDAATGTVERTIEIPKEDISQVEFSPDGKLLATASTEWFGEAWDAKARVWDVKTGRRKVTVAGGSGAARLAFSPDGKRLATGTRSGDLAVSSVASGKAVFTIKGHEQWISSVGFSPDGETLLTASGDGTVKLWDGATGARVKEIGVPRATPLAKGFVTFPAGTGAIARTSVDGVIRTWSAKDGLLTRQLAYQTFGVSSVALSPDGQKLASVAFTDVALWDAGTGERLRTFPGHTHYTNSVAFSDDGKRMVTGSFDNSVRLWDTATGKALQVWGGHAGWVLAVAFSRDGKHVVSGADDKHARLFDVSDEGQLRDMKHPDAVRAAAISPDGKTVATGCADKMVRLWAFETGSLVVALPGHGSGVSAVAFSPDGKTLASGSADGGVRLWTADGAPIATLEGHAHPVTSVAFSADGARFASTSEDGVVRVWTAAGAPVVALVPAAPPPPSGFDRRQNDAVKLLPDTPTPAVVTSGDAAPYFEVLGDAPLGEGPLCKAGARTYPIELCAERYEVKNLLSRALAGDRSFQDP